jgi:PAS domain-containing protein
MPVRDRVVVRCNAQCEALLGYSAGELNGKSTRIYMPSDEQW